jgi:hypothetical protein
MCAAASWQAAWGVTEFTLYYGIKGRGEAVHKQYCDYVGRLNAVLRSAEMMPEAVLYYPIRELQAEYVPQADPLDFQKMSPQTKQLVGDFEGVGAFLVKNQIPFVISDKRLTAAETGGKPFIENGEDAKKLAAGNVTKITPKSEWVVLGQFERDARDIYLLLNTDEKPYEGILTLPTGQTPRKWCQMNPADGSISETTASKTGDHETIPFRLEPRQTLIFVRE